MIDPASHPRVKDRIAATDIQTLDSLEASPIHHGNLLPPIWYLYMVYTFTF
jgi:hypothetical protein